MRARYLALNLTYGQFGGLANLTFTDPWIKGDPHRTSFRTSLFLSREVPQVFQSQENGNLRTLDDYADNGGSYAYDIDINVVGIGTAVIRIVIEGAQVAVLLALKHLWHLTAQKQ